MGLEDTVSLVTVEEGERLAVLGACATIAELVDAVVQEARVVTQVFQFVLQIRGVTLHCEVGIGDVPPVAEFKLDTAVLHVTDVGQRAGLTDVTRDGHLDDHAVGLLDVVVNAEGQLVVPEAEVQAEVGLFALLPLQVFVSQAVGL